MTTIHDQGPDAFAKRVLGRIEEEHLTPRPRWEFLLKNYAFWVLGIFAATLAALAVSATFFEIRNADWTLSPATHADPLSFFFETAPFFWVIALLLFIIVVYLYVRRTQYGYRYPLVAIMSGAAVLSFVFGTALYAVGIGATVEQALGDHPPFYRPILAAERDWWAAPEKGLLGGEVASTTHSVAPSGVVLHDLSGKAWDIDTSDLRSADLNALSRGGLVRVVGAPATSSGARFHACFVFPWEARAVRQRVATMPPLKTAPMLGGNGRMEKSDLCKNIRPYKQLRDAEKDEAIEE